MKPTQAFDAFPTRLFLLYILFFSGQAIYNTYLNLHLAAEGLSSVQIGTIVSVSTLFILVFQMLWGLASDRIRAKNTILLILYIGSAAIGMLFYLGTTFWFLLSAVVLFSIFFNPVTALQDNYMLETLEHSRWDYGQVRLGGTVGYCITVLIIGFVLEDNYGQIFWMVSLAMLACFLLFLTLPKVKGHRSRQKKTPYREIFKNKKLLGFIALNLVFSMGLNFYYSFYPIYFTSIGGNSSLVGTLMFACAVAEIPVLLVINKIVKKLGVNGTLVLAGACTSVRWFLLFVLRQPMLIVAANLLHGIGFTGFSYCIITYINQTVAKDLRATTQTANALIGSVVSRVLFGYLGGLASEIVGTNYIMLLSGVIMALATLVFALWSKGQNTRQPEETPAV